MIEENNLLMQESAEDWIMEKCESWRDHFESNYQDKFDEYYRLWRGVWSGEDSLRQSERSRLINPALQQAVESSVSEVEEATFGRGQFFDIHDDMNDPERVDIDYLKKKLTEEFALNRTRQHISECIINSAIFGTGIGEIVLHESKRRKPSIQSALDGSTMTVGVQENSEVTCSLRPIMPQNFLIDPTATSIEEALGVAIDEFVPMHQVEALIEQGIYKDVDITGASTLSYLEADQEINAYDEDKVRLTKYYGLLPRNLLEDYLEDEDEEIISLSGETPEEEHYVEVVAVIANGEHILKLEENPYMMQDRPVVAFPWDVVPSRFWGRGVCEKGYNSQKALDTELRARIDALALTVHPMMAIDASRLPRGAKLEVRPGKSILVNGNPNDILKPMNFGSVDQITFSQATQLQQMVQQATGAIDSAGFAGSINGETSPTAVSMGLGAIIKRQKRTLINFQECFLIPFIQKAAWRYMQYNPDQYPVGDYKFIPSSSLGIIAREYEVSQLVQLLQTMPADSPMYPEIIQSVVDNMNLSNRETLMAKLKEAAVPDPVAQAAAEMDNQQKQAYITVLQGQAQESAARASKISTETELLPIAAETDRLKVLSTNLQDGDQDEKEFAQRAKLAELVLKEREIVSKETIVNKQMNINN
ncbi:portal protein [bacterium]|nr:portal protein [bacterium]